MGWGQDILASSPLGHTEPRALGRILPHKPGCARNCPSQVFLHIFLSSSSSWDYPCLNVSPVGSHRTEVVSAAPRWGKGAGGHRRPKSSWCVGTGGPMLPCVSRLKEFLPRLAAQLGGHPSSVSREVIPLGGPGISRGAPGCKDCPAAPHPLAGWASSSFLCCFCHYPSVPVSIANQPQTECVRQPFNPDRGFHGSEIWIKPRGQFLSAP